MVYGNETLTKYLAGVGMGMSPQQWLKPGDTVEVNVSKIGLEHFVTGYNMYDFCESPV